MGSPVMFCTVADFDLESQNHQSCPSGGSLTCTHLGYFEIPESHIDMQKLLQFRYGILSLSNSQASLLLRTFLIALIRVWVGWLTEGVDQDVPGG